MSHTFSFIIPVYNGAHTIAATLDSIAHQTHRPLEVIVVDNGSTDRTKQVVSQFKGAKYIYLSQKGRSRARNKGAALARGNYLAFVDADVILSPTWLEKVAEYLTELPVDALATRVERYREGDNVVDAYRDTLVRVTTDKTFLSVQTPDGAIPMINTAASVFCKKSFREVGGVNLSFARHEDLEISLRLFFKGYFLGGASSAISRVRFAVNSGIPRSRELAYLWRAVETEFLALFPEAPSSVGWPVLKNIWKEKGLSSDLAFAFLVEFAKILGRGGSHILGSERPLDLQIGLGKKTLSCSFSYMNKCYFPRKSVNFIFVDKDVYAVTKLKKRQSTTKLGSSAAQGIRKLAGRKNLSQHETRAMLKLKCFAPWTA